MTITQKQILKNILFLDIESVSCAPNYQDLDENFQVLWSRKANILGVEEPDAISDLFFQKAGIYAEFGKVIVIGLGFFTFDDEGTPNFRVKSISSHDEYEVLNQFREIVERFPQGSLRLCAHNGKEFDVPYLCRRMVTQGVPLPPALDIRGKKPWEVNHLDTMELWKFGDRKNFTSLHLLATLFGITSSKEIMRGDEVNHYYYKKNDLDTINQYCKQDVIVAAQVFLKMHGFPLIDPSSIIMSD